MIIDCVSDTHGHYPKLEGGDLLLLGGDYVLRDQYHEYEAFFDWLRAQDYRMKIFISGNHDNQSMFQFDWGDDIEYLLDGGTEFEGLRIWGSPWTKTFEGMNPHCKAFTFDTEEELDEKFKLIPSDVDVLVTHSPPFAVLDRTIDGRQVGSTALLTHHLNRIKPRVWVWGHIHESYGRDGPYPWHHVTYVNASHVNERYKPVNPPVRVTL